MGVQLWVYYRIFLQWLTLENIFFNDKGKLWLNIEELILLFKTEFYKNILEK